MRQADDKKTTDLLGEMYDLAGAVLAAPTKQERAAARAARYRERNGLAALTVNIDAATLAAFEMKCAGKGVTKSAEIERLLKTQLLRKR